MHGDIGTYPLLIRCMTVIIRECKISVHMENTETHTLKGPIWGEEARALPTHCT